ncbi:hypothetical protein [Streptomyces sp. NEAU-L66]|uniref:hypothetical protein n=1 Tax=Streptomyces TaxID=1883 RepID=UPI0039C70D0F
MTEGESHLCVYPPVCDVCRAYPLPHAGPDERFSECLVRSVGQVLAGHGYPPVENVWDWADLEIALAGFLYHHETKEKR